MRETHKCCAGRLQTASCLQNRKGGSRNENSKAGSRTASHNTNYRVGVPPESARLFAVELRLADVGCRVIRARRRGGGGDRTRGHFRDSKLPTSPLLQRVKTRQAHATGALARSVDRCAALQLSGASFAEVVTFGSTRARRSGSVEAGGSPL